MTAEGIDSPNLLQQAHALHRQGRLAEAERIYAQVLRGEPGNVLALHLMGVLALQSGQAQQGAALLAKAIALDPGRSALHGDLGKALLALGRPADALECFDRAIALAPETAEFHASRAASLADRKRLDEALASQDRAIGLNPDQAALHADRAALLESMGRVPEALAAQDKAIELAPATAQFHDTSGSLLMRLARPEQALKAFDAAVALHPSFFQAWNNRGAVLAKLDRAEEALASYDRALALKPESAVAHCNRGSPLAKLGRHQEALAAFDRAILLQPGYALAHAKKSELLKTLGRAGDALQSIEQAILLEPQSPGFRSARGALLSELGQPEAALASLDEALARDPGHADAHYNKAAVLLAMGRFDEGWPEYEWRKAFAEAAAAQNHAAPQWTGEPLAGKTLYVHAEQGLGDTLQFCRYAVPARLPGARILLAVPGRLRRLLGSLDPGVEILDLASLPPAFDYHIPLLSLPLALNLSARNWPGAPPYLFPETEREASWRARIGTQGLKIGVCWRGSDEDPGRSFDPACLAPLASLPDVRLIGLQKDAAGELRRGLPDGMRVEMFDGFDAGPDAFLDCAAAMASLDLVVSPDTAIAHLAGALGRPVWIALKYAPDWRWFIGRSDSPWYPTARLFHQASPGDWNGVMNEMAMAMRERR